VTASVRERNSDAIEGRLLLLPSSGSQIEASADYRFDRLACNVVASTSWVRLANLGFVGLMAAAPALLPVRQLSGVLDGGGAWRRSCDAMASFTAAVVQAAAVGFDLDRGLDKVALLASEASAGGAALAVFPEAFLPGYPRGITFGTVVGDRTAEGRDQSGAISRLRWTCRAPRSTAWLRSLPRTRCPDSIGRRNSVCWHECTREG
jgi:hypothetical protein